MGRPDDRRSRAGINTRASRDSGIGGVVGCGHVMDDARQSGIAPSLVDLQVNVTIRPLLAAERVRASIARDPERRARQVGEPLAADFVGADSQGYAIAEFPGVSDLIDAV